MGGCCVTNPKNIQPATYGMSMVAPFPGNKFKAISIQVPRLQIQSSPLYQRRRTTSHSSASSPVKHSPSRKASDPGWDFSGSPV